MWNKNLVSSLIQHKTSFSFAVLIVGKYDYLRDVSGAGVYYLRKLKHINTWSFFKWKPWIGTCGFRIRLKSVLDVCFKTTKKTSAQALNQNLHINTHFLASFSEVLSAFTEGNKQH